jgi:hypothetical protein
LIRRSMKADSNSSIYVSIFLITSDPDWHVF